MAKLHVVASKLATETLRDGRERGKGEEDGERGRKGLRERERGREGEGERRGSGGRGRIVPVNFVEILRCKQNVD